MAKVTQRQAFQPASNTSITNNNGSDEGVLNELNEYSASAIADAHNTSPKSDSSKEACACATRSQIVKVAAERFSHYGYGKTTIADIAEDCGMSAGNIYRYYDSKLDIAAAIIHKTTEDLVVEMYDKASKMNKARDRLRVLLFENLRATYRILEENPKLEDMIIAVRKGRPEIRRWARKMERKMIADALEYGKETKEFSIDCINSVARIIQCLVSRFRWSKISSPHVELKRLETELEATFVMVNAALSAGCSLGKIMSGHPKAKDKEAAHHISETEAQLLNESQI